MLAIYSRQKETPNFISKGYGHVNVESSISIELKSRIFRLITIRLFNKTKFNAFLSLTGVMAHIFTHQMLSWAYNISFVVPLMQWDVHILHV